MIQRKSAFLWLAMVLCLLPQAFAQSSGGPLTGMVTDAKGALLAGVTVTATDPKTKQTFTATTDGQGRYQLAGLPAGTYVGSLKARATSTATA